MPGRGASWKKGGLRDGSVTEDDIDPAYQAIIEGGAGHTIQDEGTPLPSQPNLNFEGAGVTVTDDAGNSATKVTIPSGLGGGIPESGLPSEEWWLDQFMYVDPATHLPNWVHSGGTISATQIFGGAGDGVLGAITLTPAGGSGNIAEIRSVGGIVTSFDFEIIFKIQTDNQINRAVRIGLVERNEASPTGSFPYSIEPLTYIWFKNDATPFNITWDIATNDGVTPQSSDTGFGTQGNFVVLKIKFTAGGSGLVEFFGGGGGFGNFTLLGSFSSNLPLGSIFDIIISGQNGSGSGIVRVDTVFVKQKTSN